MQKADDRGQPPPLELKLIAAEAQDEANRRTVTVPQLDDLDTVLEDETDEVRKQIDAAVDAAIDQSVSAPVLLAVSNTGTSGIRNLFVQISIKASSKDAEVTDASNYRVIGTSWVQSKLLLDKLAFFGGGEAFSVQPSWSTGLSEVEALTKEPDGWHFAFEWGALQPQRIRAIKPQLIVSAKSDTQFEFEAKVFADSFPEPVRLKAKLDVAVRFKRMNLLDLIPNLDSFRKSDEAKANVPKGTKIKA